jgi:hypothetical protein
MLSINNKNKTDIDRNLISNNSVVDNKSKYDDVENKFIIFDGDGKLMGTFSIFQIIKYLICNLKQNEFFTNIDCSYCVSAIEKYICITSKNDKNETEIKLLDHLSSSFMGDIVMTMKLYYLLHNNEKNIQHELNMVDDERAKLCITKIIRQFTYLLLNHNLKLIANISDIVKNDKDGEIKDNLLKYSVVLTQKLVDFMSQEMNDGFDNIKKIQHNFTRLENLKIAIHDKMENMQKNMNIQSTDINNLMSKIDIIDDIITLTDKKSEEPQIKKIKTYSSSNSNIMSFESDDDDFESDSTGEYDNNFKSESTESESSGIAYLSNEPGQLILKQELQQLKPKLQQEQKPELKQQESQQELKQQELQQESQLQSMLKNIQKTEEDKEEDKLSIDDVLHELDKM